MARKASKTNKAKLRAARRKAAPGQTLARKQYPYVTAEQRKSGAAPAMEGFINKNRVALEEQGNRPGALKNHRMSQTAAKGKLRSNWNKAAKKGNITRLMRSQGISKDDAKSALTKAHKVSFTSDPKKK